MADCVGSIKELRTIPALPEGLETPTASLPQSLLDYATVIAKIAPTTLIVRQGWAMDSASILDSPQYYLYDSPMVRL